MSGSPRIEAEDRCYQIRWRAANKAGELLKAMEKAKPGGDMRPGHRSPKPTDAPKTLAELGISKQQSSDWHPHRRRARCALCRQRLEQNFVSVRVVVNVAPHAVQTRVLCR
jgi:hypothetical protein